MIDLTIIALLQITALAYGVHTIFQGRPAFIVFSKDRFETISTADIDADSMKTALANNNKLADASWLGPKWIAATPSKNEDRRQETGNYNVICIRVGPTGLNYQSCIHL